MLEIRLVFNDEDMPAALLYAWRSVRKLPAELHIPIARQLIEEDYPHFAANSEVIEDMMIGLFPLLTTYLDPEILQQYDEADRDGAEEDEGYVYEPSVRKYLQALGLNDLANTKIE